MMHGIVSILIVVVVFVLYVEIRKWRIKKKLRYFESLPNQYPIIGVAGRFLGKSNDEFIDTILNAFDEVKTTPAQVWFGPILAVRINILFPIQRFRIETKLNLNSYFLIAIRLA